MLWEVGIVLSKHFNSSGGSFAPIQLRCLPAEILISFLVLRIGSIKINYKIKKFQSFTHGIFPFCIQKLDGFQTNLIVTFSD